MLCDASPPQFWPATEGFIPDCVKQKVSSSVFPNEGAHGIRSKVTLDVMSYSPFVSQANKREFGRRN